jgi:hypothetical protein
MIPIGLANSPSHEHFLELLKKWDQNLLGLEQDWEKEKQALEVS